MCCSFPSWDCTSGDIFPLELARIMHVTFVVLGVVAAGAALFARYEWMQPESGIRGFGQIYRLLPPPPPSTVILVPLVWSDKHVAYASSPPCASASCHEDAIRALLDPPPGDWRNDNATLAAALPQWEDSVSAAYGSVLRLVQGKDVDGETLVSLLSIVADAGHMDAMLLLAGQLDAGGQPSLHDFRRAAHLYSQIAFQPCLEEDTQKFGDTIIVGSSDAGIAPSPPTQKTQAPEWDSGEQYCAGDSALDDGSCLTKHVDSETSVRKHSLDANLPFHLRPMNISANRTREQCQFYKAEAACRRLATMHAFGRGVVLDRNVSTRLLHRGGALIAMATRGRCGGWRFGSDACRLSSIADFLDYTKRRIFEDRTLEAIVAHRPLQTPQPSVSVPLHIPSQPQVTYTCVPVTKCSGSSTCLASRSCTSVPTTFPSVTASPSPSPSPSRNTASYRSIWASTEGNTRSLEFYVKWEGYPEQENTWEAGTMLLGYKKFLRYCSRHDIDVEGLQFTDPPPTALPGRSTSCPIASPSIPHDWQV